MAPLLEELQRRGILDEDTAQSVADAARTSDKRVEEELLDRGVISEDRLFEIKSEVSEHELEKVYPQDIPRDVLNLIPQESAAHYSMVPVARDGDTLTVGMVYPGDIQAQEALQFLAREGDFDYQVVLITPSDFNDILERYRSLRGEVKQALSQLGDEDEKELEHETGKTPTAKLEEMVEEAPVTKLVAVVLRHAVEGRASDIHIEPTREKTRVRFRVDGVLHSSLFLPSRVHSAVIARVKIMSNMKIDETRIPQDGRFSTEIGNQVIDFRVSTFPTTLGEKVALRVLDPSMGRQSFRDLGIIEHNEQVLREVVEQPYGTVLATGPTGSGKTTTLYALLNVMNKEGVNIVTVEDPVEYRIEGLNQSRVKPDLGYGFANALRNILRQDPDIIMVGEIRDEETVTLATHASLTGHMLLSTLHTNNATGVVPRLIDLGIQPFLLASTLASAIGQRLVRRLCENCRYEADLSGEMEEMIFKELESIPDSARADIELPERVAVYRAEGCKECNFQGYTGRIGVFEILRMTDRLAKLIRENPSEQEIVEEAHRQGMITMRQDGILKVIKGFTSMEEVLRVTTSDYQVIEP